MYAISVPIEDVAVEEDADRMNDSTGTGHFSSIRCPLREDRMDSGREPSSCDDQDTARRVEQCSNAMSVVRAWWSQSSRRMPGSNISKYRLACSVSTAYSDAEYQNNEPYSPHEHTKMKSSRSWSAEAASKRHHIAFVNFFRSAAQFRDHSARVYSYIWQIFFESFRFQRKILHGYGC